ncbi:MAG: abortive infection family protein [Dehalococcoidia bacterium]|nr:abortive infection family protein [Dehalococcoidia bacterium]
MPDRIKRLFGVFSRRHSQLPAEDIADVPRETRTRIVLLLRNTVSGLWGEQMNPNADALWGEVHLAMEILYARPILSKHFAQRSLATYDLVRDDLYYFLDECTTKEFLDFLELAFQADNAPESYSSADRVIESINGILTADGLPYRLTGYVKREEREFASPALGIPAQEMTVIKTISYPMVVREDDEIVYEEALAPALRILEAPHFQGSNEEFREALKHYREAEYKECLTSCGSALESVLKVICDRKGLTYGSRDVLGDLLDIVVPKLGLESAFKEKFKLVATIRNRFSSSHGGGQAPRKPERHFAQYMITATAGVIVLLVAVAEGGKSSP